LDTMDEAEMLKKVVRHCDATALASIVLPVPVTQVTLHVTPRSQRGHTHVTSMSQPGQPLRQASQAGPLLSTQSPPSQALPLFTCHPSPPLPMSSHLRPLTYFL
jgi:hypothetical protein